MTLPPMARLVRYAHLRHDPSVTAFLQLPPPPPPPPPMVSVVCLGLGRIVALYCRLSTPHQIH
jgi:hypothetical protein